MSVSFKNKSEVTLYKPNWSTTNTGNTYSASGLAKNTTFKNTKRGHFTVEAKYNAEKNRLNALKKKQWRSLFTEHWMKLYKNIINSDERFDMNTEESDAVSAELYSLLRSGAKGRAHMIRNMPINNAQKAVIARDSLNEFIERANKLTYDILLVRIKQAAATRAMKLQEAKAIKAATKAKPVNLTRLSGKKRNRNMNNTLKNPKNTKH